MSNYTSYKNRSTSRYLWQASYQGNSSLHSSLRELMHANKDIIANQATLSAIDKRIRRKGSAEVNGLKIIKIDKDI